jgi:hypothetical protein
MTTNGSTVTISLAEPVSIDTFHATNFSGAGGSLTNLNINSQTNSGPIVILEPTGTNQPVTQFGLTNAIGTAPHVANSGGVGTNLTLLNVSTNLGNTTFTNITKTADGGTNYSFSANNGYIFSGINSFNNS